MVLGRRAPSIAHRVASSMIVKWLLSCFRTGVGRIIQFKTRVTRFPRELRLCYLPVQLLLVLYIDRLSLRHVLTFVVRRNGSSISNATNASDLLERKHCIFFYSLCPLPLRARAAFVDGIVLVPCHVRAVELFVHWTVHSSLTGAACHHMMMWVIEEWFPTCHWH